MNQQLLLMRLVLLALVLHRPELGLVAAPAISFDWASRMGGTGDDLGRSIAVDPSGALFVCGHFNGTAEFGHLTLRSPDRQAGFIVKLDSFGRVRWARQFGGQTDDEYRSVAVDQAGNCLVTGNFRSTATFGTASNGVALASAGGADIFLAKYSTAGDLLWARRAGGTGNDYGQSLAVDQQNNIHLTGSFEFVAAFEGVDLPGREATQLFVAKYKSDGILLWVKDISGGESASGLAIAVDAEGQSCVTGKFNAGSTRFSPGSLQNTAPVLKADFFVAKYDQEGKTLWYRVAGGTGTDQGLAVAFDPTGHVLVAGSFDSRISFGPFTLINPPNLGIFLAKYDPAGKVLWAAKPGGDHRGEAHGVRTDAASHTYLAGYFYGTAVFGRTTLSTGGNPALFVAKYNEDGQVLGAVQTEGSAIVNPLGFTTDTEGHAFATGYFRGDASVNNSFLPNAGGRDVFVTRLNIPLAFPSLTIFRGAGALTIHWPEWGAGFQLEAAGRLLAAGQWRPISNSIARAQGKFIFTNVAAGDMEFYRLRKP